MLMGKPWVRVPPVNSRSSVGRAPKIALDVGSPCLKFWGGRRGVFTQRLWKGGPMKKVLVVLAFAMFATNLAYAGVIRHVVKPVVKAGAHAAVKTVKAVKTVAY